MIPVCQPWWTAEVLSAVNLIESAAHHYSAQRIPGFPRYPYGLVVIWASDRRWVVPVRADGSVRRFDEFEPSECQWERWLVEWQALADQWGMWTAQAPHNTAFTVSWPRPEKAAIL